MIVKQTGPVSYIVRLSDGRSVRRHVDHIRKCFDETVPETEVTIESKAAVPEIVSCGHQPRVVENDQPTSLRQDQPIVNSDVEPPSQDVLESKSKSVGNDNEQTVPIPSAERPRRARKLPAHLQDYDLGT